ncbi:MAG: hypothetical protein KAJ93_00915 [Methanosarcinales archaeon]|nr:hypothetical protein [Methanosarcinales archaeon]
MLKKTIIATVLLILAVASSGCVINGYDVKLGILDVPDNGWCPIGTPFQITDIKNDTSYTIKFTGIEAIDGTDMCRMCGQIGNETKYLSCDIYFDEGCENELCILHDSEGNIFYTSAINFSQ